TWTPTPLGSLCPQAPAPLLRLIEAAMSRRRDRRPTTATDFVARLKTAAAAPAGRAADLDDDGAVDLPGLSALEAGVLVDVAGDDLPVPVPLRVRAAAAPALDLALPALPATRVVATGEAKAAAASPA